VDYGNEGCDGGFMDQAFWYIIDKGIATNKTYPPSSNSTKCKYVLNMKYTGFSKCARIPKGSYSKLLSAIVQQPVSVALNQVADMRDFKGGIYDDKCTSTLNHGMLLVGYGGAQAEKYFWRLKNSLGVSWGDNGFINLKRVESDGDGKCGIQIWASVPQNLN
jgi:cathepsin L